MNNNIPFPLKLHKVLEDVAASSNNKNTVDVISWIPPPSLSSSLHEQEQQRHDKDGFKIYDRTSFINQIMPLYFPRMNGRYGSFLRQLNLYGFERVKWGPDRGAYVHSLFVRGQPNLCHNMVRKKNNSKGNSTTTTSGTTPRGRPPATAGSAATAAKVAKGTTTARATASTAQRNAGATESSSAKKRQLWREEVNDDTTRLPINDKIGKKRKRQQQSSTNAYAVNRNISTDKNKNNHHTPNISATAKDATPAVAARASATATTVPTPIIPAPTPYKDLMRDPLFWSVKDSSGTTKSHSSQSPPRPLGDSNDLLHNLDFAADCFLASYDFASGGGNSGEKNDDELEEAIRICEDLARCWCDNSNNNSTNNICNMPIESSVF